MPKPMEKLGNMEDVSIDMRGELNELIEHKKQVLATLHREILQEQISLASAKKDAEEFSKQAKYDRQIELSNFKKSLEHEKLAINSERRELERLDLELESRKKDVEALEAKSRPIQDAINKLRDERIAIEQQRVRNEELRVENEHLANATSSMHQEVADLKAKLSEERNRLAAQSSAQEQDRINIEAAKKDLALQLENLNELKKTIDPKLAEVKSLQASAEKDLEQAKVINESITKERADLDKQRSDVSILSSQLEAKGKALTEFSAQLKRTEDELRIKIQQSQVKDVKLPEAPKVA